MAAAMKSLEDAFVHELQDMLSAEQQIMKALPKMSKKASNPDLKKAFDEHLHQTERQAERLKEAFQSIGKSSKAHKCEGIEGIIKEGESMLKGSAEPEVIDAALIAAAQKVEHYEIATYGTVCQWAEQLGFDEAHELLGENLSEEKATDSKLSQLAKKSINVQAEREV